MKSFLQKAISVKSRMKVRIKVILPAAAMALCLFTACSSTKLQQYQRVDTAMGTILRETVYTNGAEDITEEIRDIIVSLEENVLSWRKESSRVYEINEGAGHAEGVLLTEELAEILKKVVAASRESHGALDVTIGQTVRLWSIDEYAAGSEKSDFTLPDQGILEDTLQKSGYEKMILQDDRIYLPEGMELDLGAVGKGIACDEILNFLRNQSQVQGAVISIGGSILTYGEKPDGKLWNVGIVDPFEPSSYLGSLTLDGQWCVSTSGDYERYVEVDGVRYHHIIDPSNGYPAHAGLRSVTILSKDGCLSDALSTSCFVLGKEEGLKLLEKYEAYAVMVEEDGSIVLSPGVETFFKLTVQTSP